MDFIPLRISTVKPLRKLTFDLYIYFKDHYLCYAKRGEQLSEEKFQKLKSQDVAKFFITESDEINYQIFLDALLAETLSNPQVPLEEKIDMAEGACSSALDRMQQNPGSANAFSMTEKAAKSLRQVIKNNPEALKKLFGKKAENNEEIIKHSLNVCALACKLAEIKGCTEEELDDLGTAALLHDIAILSMKKSDIKLFYQPKKFLSTDDKRIYNLHVKEAANLLKDKPFMTASIMELINNHEEVLRGVGPNKKKKLSLLEEILSMVNNYDKRIITGKTTPLQTVKEMMIDEIGNYSLGLLNDFKKLLIKEGLLE